LKIAWEKKLIQIFLEVALEIAKIWLKDHLGLRIVGVSHRVPLNYIILHKRILHNPS